jgi:hypothetical protein
MVPVSSNSNAPIVHPNAEIYLAGLERRNCTKSSCTIDHSPTTAMPNRTTMLHDRFAVIVSRSLLITMCPLISLFQNWWLLAHDYYVIAPGAYLRDLSVDRRTKGVCISLLEVNRSSVPPVAGRDLVRNTDGWFSRGRNVLRRAWKGWNYLPTSGQNLTQEMSDCQGEISSGPLLLSL